MSSTSEDIVLMKQVRATHAPDSRKFAINPLLYIIEDIFQHASLIVPSSVQGKQAQLDVFDDENFQSEFFDMLDLLSHTIYKVSQEMSSMCSEGTQNAHETTLEILKFLTRYSWDAKVVLALAAFALNYGEFPVVVERYPSGPLAQSIALIQQLPEVLECVNTLKPTFQDFESLVKAMLDLTKRIVEFGELPSKYINPNTPEMLAATAHTITGVYWIIRSSVVCLAQILDGLIRKKNENITSEGADKPPRLTNKINSIHERLTEQLLLCNQLVDKEKQIEAYQGLVRLIEMPHIENIKVLMPLICAKDDQLPLVECSTMKRVSIDVVRRKYVLLLISDLLDDFNDELFILDQVYEDLRQHRRTEIQQEVVWMPIVDRSSPWTDEDQDQFEFLLKTMQWYSVYHPSMIDLAVIRYVKEKWGFNKKPILVVLDIQGRIVNKNAFHMMRIWGSRAFPYTSSKEEELWKEESWTIELLADAVYENIPTWISEDRYICLYGGDDIEWIRNFTNISTDIAKDANVLLKILYVGKSHPKKESNVSSNIVYIIVEKRGYTLMDVTQVRWFWTRLESMWHSKMKFGTTVENDPVMREIASLRSFDGSNKGWAVICRGGQMTKASDQTILQCLNGFDAWKKHLKNKDFLEVINDRLQKLCKDHLFLPGSTMCAYCGKKVKE